MVLCKTLDGSCRRSWDISQETEPWQAGRELCVRAAMSPTSCRPAGAGAVGLVDVQALQSKLVARLLEPQALPYIRLSSSSGCTGRRPSWMPILQKSLGSQVGWRRGAALSSLPITCLACMHLLGSEGMSRLFRHAGSWRWGCRILLRCERSRCATTPAPMPGAPHLSWIWRSAWLMRGCAQWVTC